MIKKSKVLRPLTLVAALLFATSVLAASADKINRESNKALQVFKEEISGSEVFLNQAAGYLVFPRVIKVGVGVGAETGVAATEGRHPTHEGRLLPDRAALTSKLGGAVSERLNG